MRISGGTHRQTALDYADVVRSLMERRNDARIALRDVEDAIDKADSGNVSYESLQEERRQRLRTHEALEDEIQDTLSLAFIYVLASIGENHER